MRWLHRRQSTETFSTRAFPSREAAQGLILARLAHRAGPPWHDRYSDPLSWIEQISYELEDEASRTHFAAAVIDLLGTPGARWAALTLIRYLRLRDAAPALVALAASGTLRHQAEGPCSDLELALIVALEELAVHEAIPFLRGYLDDPTYAVSACLALLRLDPALAIARLPSVAAASSEAADGSSGMLGSIGSVLATTLRHHDNETFLAMVRALQACDRPVRLHAADALRRQGELEVRPELEAEARRLLLHEGI